MADYKLSSLVADLKKGSYKPKTEASLQNYQTDYNLDSLIADLKKGSYKPKTEEELQGIAGRRYQTFYDQQRLAANQAFETQDLALNRQLTNAGVDYGKQREASLQNYQNAYSQADRQSLSRGMQRSTFNAATLGNVALAGNKAQQDITDSEQRFKTDIGDQQTLLAQQLAEQLKQYSASQAADTLSYIDELESLEYERGESARRDNNSLAAQIYEFANTEKQQGLAQDNWLAEFNQHMSEYNQTLAENIRQYNETLAENIRQYDDTSASRGSSTTSGDDGGGDDKIIVLEDDMNKYLNVNGNGKPIDGAPPYNQNLKIDTSNPPAPPAFTLPKPPSLLDLHRPPVKKIVLPTKPSQQRISGLTR